LAIVAVAAEQITTDQTMDQQQMVVALGVLREQRELQTLEVEVVLEQVGLELPAVPA